MDMLVKAHGSSRGSKAASYTPRTRNLKVMRRVIRAVLTGTSPGDVTALVNPESLDELRAQSDSADRPA